MSDTEVESCQCCGDAHRELSEQCVNCSKEGPFCPRCLTHHQKHCQGVEEISDDENCSECEMDAEDVENSADEEFTEDG
jgi:hypothetical protein